jgi:hypothetical protein
VYLSDVSNVSSIRSELERIEVALRVSRWSTRGCKYGLFLLCAFQKFKLDLYFPKFGYVLCNLWGQLQFHLIPEFLLHRVTKLDLLGLLQIINLLDT